MKLGSIAQSFPAQANIEPPTVQQKYSISLPKIAAKLNSCIIPILGLLIMASLPKADGGPLSYAACCVACTALAPPAVPGCLLWCNPFLWFPSP